jgi:hypothetical protein
MTRKMLRPFGVFFILLPSALQLEAPRASGQRHVQQVAHDIVGSEAEAERDHGHRQRPPAFDHAEEEHEQRDDGQPVADAFEREEGDAACRKDDDT